MAYVNLKAELKRQGLAQKDIAKVLNIRVATANSKINGRYPFTLNEAFCIQQTLFPDLEIPYLFATETKETE